MNASNAENSRKPATAAAPVVAGLATDPLSSVASGSRSASAVATSTPAANAMKGCRRWRRRSAAVPPSKVEKKGRIANAISTAFDQTLAGAHARRGNGLLDLDHQALGVQVHDVAD